MSPRLAAYEAIAGYLGRDAADGGWGRSSRASASST